MGTKWEIELKHDIVKGQFDEKYHAYVYWDVYYILAKNRKAKYIHFVTFYDYDCALKLLNRIYACSSFSPENKVFWIKANDTNPLKKYRRRIIL